MAGGVSGSADAILSVFTIDCATMVMSVRAGLQLKNPGIGAIAIRHDGRIVATAGWDKQVRVYDYRKRKQLAVLQYHRGGVMDVCFQQRTQQFASASKDGSIAVWNIYAGSNDGCKNP